MKLIKKDFCECDNIESSIIKHGVEELSIMKKIECMTN